MEQWLYQCAGMHIVHGLAQKATNGFIGVTASGELVLFDNKGVEFDRAPVKDAEIKIGGFAGNSFKMNGNRYSVEFHPLARSLVGGLVGGAIAGWLDQTDSRSEKEKRNQLAELVKRIQQS